MSNKSQQVKFYFVQSSFYESHRDCSGILDINNAYKQGKRPHMCLDLNISDKHFLIPLRRNLRMGGVSHRIIFGHPVPSSKKPNAGLDYSNVIVLNDMSELVLNTRPAMSYSQYTKICREYNTIEKEFTNFLTEFIDLYNQNNLQSNYILANCTLNYFLNELGLKQS